MSRKRTIYIATVLGLVIGSGVLFKFWFFQPKQAQAQCMRYWLTSGDTDASTVCTGGNRISISMCNAGAGAANFGRRYVALCVGP